MGIEQTVEKLINEINGRNRKDVVDHLEEILSENIEELSKKTTFLSIASKAYFFCHFKS